MKRKILILSLLLLNTSYFTICSWADTTSPKIKLDKTLYKGLGEELTITVTAPDHNLFSGESEHVPVELYTSDDKSGITVYLQETGYNKGVFSGSLHFNLSSTNIKSRTIKVKSGTKVFASFEGTTVEAVWQSYDAALKFDKSSYGGYGIYPVITLQDSDLNLDPNTKEEIDVKVNSSSDTTGISIKLIEKSPDSGIFTGSFGFAPLKSDSNAQLLFVSYDDEIKAIYTDKLNSSGKDDLKTCTAKWKPFTGTVKLNKSTYTGLHSIASVTVSDQDLNLRKGYKDTAQVRITSESDPHGFILFLSETGANTGMFSGSFGFSTESTDSDKKIIKTIHKDSVTVTYIDEKNADNKSNAKVTAAASFELSEAKLQTTAANDAGSGNMLDITVTDLDASWPNIKDRIRVVVQSTTSPEDLILRLEETGSSTGIFKGRLFFTDGKTDNRSIKVSDTDTILIKYIDNTAPGSNAKEVSKSIKWSYQSSLLKFDKAAYTGYNSSAIVTLSNMNLNKSREKVDSAVVKVTSSSSGINFKLRETGADTGEFKGTLYFGRTSNASKGIIKAVSGDTINASYYDSVRKDTTAQCSAAWAPQDGQISLDRTEYTGNSTPVKITVKDWDIAADPNSKDTVKVTVGVAGSASTKVLVLDETYKNSGTFTGTVYINGGAGKFPSVTLKPSEKLEVVYTDKETSSGVEEYKTAYAAWGGVSEAKLELDKESYEQYNTYMAITLTDPDQNLSTTSRDKVKVQVQTKNSRVRAEVSLTETGVKTGVFTAKLKFVETGSASGAIKVMNEDEVTVAFKEKEVEARASFKGE